MAIEKTFILVKPDGVKKNLVGNILARFEAKGLKIVALKMIVAPKEVDRKSTRLNSSHTS